MHRHLIIIIFLIGFPWIYVKFQISRVFRAGILFSSIFAVFPVHWGHSDMHNPQFLLCYISIENKTVSSPHKWNKQTIQAEVHKPNWSQNLIMLIISDLYCFLKIDGCTDGWSLVPHSQPITDIGIDTTYSCCAQKLRPPDIFPLNAIVKKWCTIYCFWKQNVKNFSNYDAKSRFRT